MKVVIVNGSPRKNGNTSAMLEQAAKGALSNNADVKTFFLYDLESKGCRGCLGCKARSGNSLGKCVINDGLKVVLEAIDDADAVIFGSPIYFHDISAELRKCLERMFFQYLNYEDFSKNFASPKKAAMVYTMNVSEEQLKEFNYQQIFDNYEGMLKMFFKSAETLYATETLQTEDYSKFHLSSFNEEERKLRHQEVFPEDCRKAFELGKKLSEI